MTAPTIHSKFRFWSYRLSTILRSFKALYTLPPEKAQAFIKSYEVYNHDWADEQELIRKMGPDYYQSIKQQVINYYSVLNHLLALGQVEKMYIPPVMDLSASVLTNQILFERKMALDLGVGKESKVLDIGCGRGRIANHIASYTGAQVTGVNIDAGQLEDARRFTSGKGMADRNEFQLADLNEIPLPFADQSFDGVYEVQAFTYSKDLLKLFKDIHRILMPGAKFAALDWFSLKAYDPKDAHHNQLMRRIKPLIGAIGTISPDQFTEFLEAAGFETLVSENASIDGLQAPLFENVDRFFTRATKLIGFLVKCKILPAHFAPIFDRLTQDGEALVEADRLRLVTTCHYVLAQKR